MDLPIPDPWVHGSALRMLSFLRSQSILMEQSSSGLAPLEVKFIKKTDSEANPVMSAQWIAMLAITIFTSAFLLFQVQPLISKFILPWFGGSPAVWTTAMLFFQCLLFAGYAYAHVVTKYLSLDRHLKLHVALLILSSFAAFFVAPNPAFRPEGDENPSLRILLLLASCVGLPYFTLASTGPLVSAWFAIVYAGKSPYRLYSLSNVGSFAALVSFPYLFEPYFKVQHMGIAWTGIYLVFALVCSMTAIQLLGFINPAKKTDSKLDALSKANPVPSHPTMAQRIAWLGLPALASLTMIAATDHVSHNIAPEPRLWITTLGLYLMTFIITFDHPRWFHSRIVSALTFFGILLLVTRAELLDFLGINWDFGVSELRWSHIIVMFLICFLCHGQLIRLRPASNSYLTEFYLCISAGGALGGLFASLIATNLFDDYYEWPLCMILGVTLSLCVLLYPLMTNSEVMVRYPISKYAIPLFCLLTATAFIGYWDDPLGWWSSSSGEYESKHLVAKRNFYGTVSVEDQIHRTNPIDSYRGFYSGSVTHGIQRLSPEVRHIPTAYYGIESGVYETFHYARQRQPALKMAIVGLGAGALALGGRQQDEIDFYEINPYVVELAKKYFTYLDDCSSKINIILGDGRLKLEHAKPESYDIIMLDAFTGGSVPVHLLTQEAFKIYRERLKPDGFLVVHITNKYLNLYPVVKTHAENLGMGYRSKFLPADFDNFIRRSHYVTITNDKKFIELFPSVHPPIYDDHDNIIGRKEPNIEGLRVWTDQYSSITPLERD